MANLAHGLVSTPPTTAFAVTPSDTVDLAIAARGFFLGVAGNVTAITLDGQQVTFTSLAAGVLHWMCVTRILATGTTATSIVGVS